MATTTHYEQRSLATGKWGNLVMGVAGITAAHLSNSDALMVDGLYSAINFCSAIVAGKIALSLTKQPDERNPFGYEANEALYVLFRSLVLLGILAFAATNAVHKIVGYAQGGEVPALVFGPITIYTVVMVTICFSLAAWHHHNWKLGGKQSELLRTERSAAMVDGFISAGAGGALLAVTLLKGTPLEVIIPVADAIVVVILSVVMIGQPAGMLRSAAREIVGRSTDTETTDRVRLQIESVITDLPCELLQVAVTKLGRAYFVVSYIRPTGAVTANELDELRDELHASYADDFSQVRTEIVFTAKPPYA